MVYQISSLFLQAVSPLISGGSIRGSSPPKHIQIIGAPTPQQYQLLIPEMVRLLGLRLHESGGYYVRTDGSSGRYYPQINLSFYVEGRVAENGVDPLQPTIFVLQSTDGRLSVQRRDDRSEPLLHTKLISELKLVPNDNWTFRSTLPEYEGYTFYLQLDGSIWARQGNSDKGRVFGPHYSARSRPPLPFTLVFSQLGVAPGIYPSRILSSTHIRTMINGKITQINMQGAFRVPGDQGAYFIQRDGSIFYTGYIGSDGRSVEPYTWVNRDGAWARDISRRRPLASTLPLVQAGAYLDNEGWALRLRDGRFYTIYRALVIANDRVLRISPSFRSDNPEVQQLSGNTWRNINIGTPIDDGEIAYRNALDFNIRNSSRRHVERTSFRLNDRYYLVSIQDTNMHLISWRAGAERGTYNVQIETFTREQIESAFQSVFGDFASEIPDFRPNAERSNINQPEYMSRLERFNFFLRLLLGMRGQPNIALNPTSTRTFTTANFSELIRNDIVRLCAD